MPATYFVKQGEYLSQIAEANGFHDYQTIWNDPGNADFKTLRKNPNVLYPGDEVLIPDKVVHCESIATGARHQFVAKRVPLKLSLVLQDLGAKPLAGVTCRVDVGTASQTLTTDGGGKIQLPIPNSAQKGRLVIQTDQILDTQFDVGVGELDPIDTLTGQIGRLNNLGYDAGLVQLPAEDDEDAKLQFRSAVEEFQCDSEITVDGICGPQTQDKLKQVHGC